MKGSTPQTPEDFIKATDESAVRRLEEIRRLENIRRKSHVAGSVAEGGSEKVLSCLDYSIGVLKERLNEKRMKRGW